MGHLSCCYVAGKSTIGACLARALNCKFLDGDDVHPRSNILKMSNGRPLNDEDRAPWLTRLNDVIFSLTHKHEIGVIVCSALKRKYRDRLRADNEAIIFLYLKGSYEFILSRMRARSGHFMPNQLLRSQFDDLEEPTSDERDVRPVDIDGSIEDVTERCIQALGADKPTDEPNHPTKNSTNPSKQSNETE